MTMVCWAGNVGQDVNFRAVENYGGVASFNLAITPRIRNAEGAWVDGTTTWVRVKAWRLLAEHVRDSVHKGDAVIVYGRLDTNRWKDERNVPRDELILDATYIGHDLRRGVAQFTRLGRSAPELAPRYETDAEADLAALEAAEEAASGGAIPLEEAVVEPV